MVDGIRLALAPVAPMPVSLKNEGAYPSPPGVAVPRLHYSPSSSPSGSGSSPSGSGSGCSCTVVIATSSVVRWSDGLAENSGSDGRHESAPVLLSRRMVSAHQPSVKPRQPQAPAYPAPAAAQPVAARCAGSHHRTSTGSTR